MVDCRPATGAPPHELAHAAPNGAPPPPPENNHHNQGGGGDMGLGGAAPAARASTPASTTAMQNYVSGNQVGPLNAGMSAGAGGYGYYGKGVVWVPPVAPMPPPPPPPPHHVNPHVYKSVQLNGADLPMNDIPTLRYYFNLGVDCMWAAYGPPPARHYAPRDLAQDMQQMSLGDRGHDGHKHKPADNKPPPVNKGTGQRSLLGPRFNKRNQDGSQNPNHTQNKSHNNNMANKGPNNRRNSHEARAAGAHYGEGECVVEAPLLTVPYIPYPPPVYPIQYYPVDSADPAMMGMMGGMGYVNYEEGGEFVPPAYYPHPVYPHPPHHMHPHMQMQEHK